MSTSDRKNRMLFLNPCKDLQVIGIYMYLQDGCYGHLWQDVDFWYDLVLTNGESKLKCFLAPKLYELIRTGKLTLGTTVHVRKSYVKGNVAIVEDLLLTGMEPTSDPSKIPFYLHHNDREVNPVPLCAMRSYYLHPWLMKVPYGPRWSLPLPSLRLTTPVLEASRRCTLRNLETRFVRPKAKRPYPQIIATVLHRGKFNNFGKTGRANANPFQGFFLLGDHTGFAGAVMWGQRNAGTYSHINSGELVLVDNYTLEESYYYKHLGRRFKKQPVLPLEIKLNDYSTIRFVMEDEIPEDVVSRAWSPFPYPVYRFVSRRVLRNLRHGKRVDVIGYVTYASHSMRERVDDLERFCAYRWIEMMDDTSPLPMRVKLYLDHQWQVQEQIMPGQILLCTCVRVVRYALAYSHDLVQLFAKSTFETSVFTELPKYAIRERRVQDFLCWIRKVQDRLEMDLVILSCRVGGLAQPLNVKLTKLDFLNRQCKSTKRTKAVQRCKTLQSVSPGTDWISVTRALAIRERRSIIICGSIVEIGYLKSEGNRIRSRSLFRSSANSSCNNDPMALHYLMAFPRAYLPDLKDDLLRLLRLPPFSAEFRWTPVTPNEMSSLPFFPTHAYKVVIQSHDQPISMTTVFFHRAITKHPFPSMENFLKRKYETSDFSAERPTSVESVHPQQNVKLKKTAVAMADKIFLFKVDLFRYGVNQIVAVLHSAIVENKCPMPPTTI